MLSDIAFFRLLGLPLVAWCGYVGLVALSGAALVPFWNRKMTRLRLPFQWHRRIAGFGLALSIIHALMYQFS